MNEQQKTERFYELVWPHLQAVARVARILSGRSDEADDLAQETMLKAYRSLESFREGTDVKAWLMAILRNSRIDRLRSRGAEVRDVSLEQLDFEPAERRAGDDGVAWQRPQDLLNAFSDQQIIKSLQELPEEIRWTLLLVDVEGMELSEAATILGVPVGTIKSRSHRGRAMLKEALAPLAREMRMVKD